MNGVTVVAVDSSEPDLDHGVIGRGRYAWIEEQFAEPADFRIFVLHHHLLPVPGTGRERNVVYDAGDALEVLQHAGVNLVLSGHKHVPYAWRLENLFVVNAGTVSSLRLRGKTRPCYNLIEIEDRHVDVWRKYPFHGQERIIQFSIDTLEYEKYTARIEDRADEAAMRALALVDGEHYPDVVVAALAELDYEVVGAVMLGGTEKLRGGVPDYGVPALEQAGRRAGRSGRGRRGRPLRRAGRRARGAGSGSPRARSRTGCPYVGAGLPPRPGPLHALRAAGAGGHRHGQARREDRGRGPRRAPARAARARSSSSPWAAAAPPSRS